MTYCAICGSRNVHIEEWRHVNTGAFVGEGAGDFYCGDCETECCVTDVRAEAARARLGQRLRDAAGCSCGAELEPPGPYRLEAHACHCDAAKAGAA